ncbi:inositol monophosphatase family protein [Krasilnikoviella flava]|uniref:Myo-inositol-1(Or 4)-monophosphatase n=1 Tax=Krasilnikoviella flava TaxID=526729 RepID=A0A1T5KVF8_9MICO|nr:inositol monophosphatase family protein [Krasilnikoviella flava]SKC67208.1 myo-inositol-1(or 4)-monophosphatase [Krasilnikoviella flava]
MTESMAPGSAVRTPRDPGDVEVAVSAALAGAAEVSAAYRHPVTRHAKSALDFATDTDVAAERAIRAVLATARPGDGVVGEELGATGGDAARRWYVDPLCGTLNFAAGVPAFGVNVALVARDRGGERVLAAAVADPLTGEVIWTDGSRTRVRGARPGVREEDAAPTPVTRLVNVDVDNGGRAPALVADAALRAAFAVRVASTSLALAWVAVGRQAAYLTGASVDDSVHFLPGVALCEAAGCVVTDLDGGPVRGGRGILAAADAETSHRLLARLGALGGTSPLP